MTDAEGFEVLRTPAWKAVMRKLLEAGTWVPAADFAGCSASSLALENALADVVMVGLVEYQAAAGYRLRQPALARAAGRELAKSPGLDRVYLTQQREGRLDVGVAMRLADGEVALCVMQVDEPAGLAGSAAAQWAADAVVRCMAGEVAHG